jgi:hypothetical protein
MDQTYNPQGQSRYSNFINSGNTQTLLNEKPGSQRKNSLKTAASLEGCLISANEQKIKVIGNTKKILRHLVDNLAEGDLTHPIRLKDIRDLLGGKKGLNTARTTIKKMIERRFIEVAELRSGAGGFRRFNRCLLVAQKLFCLNFSPKLKELEEYS